MSGSTAAVMAYIGTAATIAAAGTAAYGSIQQGKAAKSEAKFQSEQYKRKATEERALASREALNRRREAYLVSSRALAISAAGGGAGDVGNINRIAQLEAGGEYNAETALYEGMTAANTLNTESQASLYYGRNKSRAYNIQAGSEIFKGVSSVAGQYK